MSLSIDPWGDKGEDFDCCPHDVTPAQPDLTADEWVAIRDDIRDYTFGDPSLLPDCFQEALKVLGEVGLQGDPQSRRTATQCLRGMAYRAKTGVPFNEPTEPAWSLDSERGLPR